MNLTLPDETEDYIHRVGRVGRADRMGLAISLVSASGVGEKVWYHTCGGKGNKCENRKLKGSAGGCCTWLDESDQLEKVCVVVRGGVLCCGVC